MYPTYSNEHINGESFHTKLDLIWLVIIIRNEKLKAIMYL